MAVDETLFRSAVAGDAPPTVRLYSWSRPTLSIGFRQNLGETCDIESCRDLGIDTVRRLSGGRAVLHDKELTYCVAAGAQGHFRGLSVRSVYRWVGRVLHKWLERNGAPMDPLPSSSKRSAAPQPENDSLPCFAVPTGHELTSGGRKLVGSAQKWSRRGFMQHGSVLLSLDSALWAKVVGLETAKELNAVGLNELVEDAIPLTDLMRDLAVEFENAMGQRATENGPSPPELGVQCAAVKTRIAKEKVARRRLPLTVTPGRLSDFEIETARHLAETKYSSDEWNVFRSDVARPSRLEKAI